MIPEGSLWRLRSDNECICNFCEVYRGKLFRVHVKGNMYLFKALEKIHQEGISDTTTEIGESYTRHFVRVPDDELDEEIL
jgi:hypothetical protein